LPGLTADRRVPCRSVAATLAKRRARRGVGMGRCSFSAPDVRRRFGAARAAHCDPFRTPSARVRTRISAPF
jgi:hypothetical protein